MAQVPPSTADVIEFRCQYTFNIVQKKKKWNDGCLKFHTFNKLIRVLDEDNNHVGQKHWQGGEGLQDGDEFQLDNMLVSVQDILRCTQTNIAPLFEKRKKPSVNGVQNGTSYSHASRATPQVHADNAVDIVGRLTEANPSSMRTSQHKSLSALLGVRRGPTGKAIAPVSPFEVRRNTHDEHSVEESPSKRRRIDTSDDAPWTVTTTTKPRKTGLRMFQSDISGTSKQHSLVKKKKKSDQVKTAASQKTLRIKSVIDLTAGSSPSRASDSEYACQDTSAAGNARDDASAATTGLDAVLSTHSRSQMVNIENTQIHNAMPPPQRSTTVSSLVSMPGPSLDTDDLCRRKQPNTVGLDKSKAVQRKQLLLQSSKRKSTLMCMQTKESTSAPVGEIRTNSLHRDRVDNDSLRSIIGHDQSAQDAYAGQAFSRRNHSTIDRAESLVQSEAPQSMREERPPLRDILQRSDMLRRQNLATTHATGHETAALIHESPTRKVLGRCQSDPSSMSMQFAGSNETHIRSRVATTIARPNKRSLRRTQTLAATSEEFQIPTSIFTQLPPEVDKDKDDLGPWSREAFDLFDWRPPDWEQRLASKPLVVAMVD